MQLTVTINGVDFTPWLTEGGVSFSPIVRQGRDIVFLNGVLSRKQVSKRGLSLSLVTLKDTTLERLREAADGLCTVIVSGARESGVPREYYVSGFAYAAKTVRGGNTYYSGVSFDLEER